MQAYGGSTVQETGDVVTATRDGDGNQGITISQSPVLVTFAAEGEDVRVRVRQGGEWIELPASPQHSVMIGRGGASQIRVFSRNAETLTTRIVSVTDCGAAGVTCSPLPTAASDADAEPAASDEIRP